MQWEVVVTEGYEKWRKKENVTDVVFGYHKQALHDFCNVNLHHNVQSCHFKTDRYQCWESRLPDKERNKGKSGGFRVVFILDLEDKVLLLQGIFRREHLDWKGSSGKYTNQHLSLLDDLKREFI